MRSHGKPNSQRWNSYKQDHTSFESVMTRMGTGGRYLDTARALSPFDVTTMISPADTKSPGRVKSRLAHDACKTIVSSSLNPGGPPMLTCIGVDGVFCRSAHHCLHSAHRLRHKISDGSVRLGYQTCMSSANL